MGNIPLSEIADLIVLAPMYGGGALLIRETARRTRRGWPTILTPGLAYGVLDAGLLDQSLFNPTFEEHHFQAVTPIPALGISALSGHSFIVGHAVWASACRSPWSNPSPGGGAPPRGWAGPG